MQQISFFRNFWDRFGVGVKTNGTVGSTTKANEHTHRPDFVVTSTSYRSVSTTGTGRDRNTYIGNYLTSTFSVHRVKWFPSTRTTRYLIEANFTLITWRVHLNETPLCAFITWHCATLLEVNCIRAGSYYYCRAPQWNVSDVQHAKEKKNKLPDRQRVDWEGIITWHESVGQI